MSIQSERIKQRRKQLNMSQEELAHLIGTGQGQISRYEQGINDPTAETLRALARALETSTDWLVGLTDVVESGWHGPPDLDDLEKHLIQIWRTKSADDRQRFIKIVEVV